MSEQSYIRAIHEALLELPRQCRYHGENLERAGIFGPACCDTGAASLKRIRAQQALDKLRDELEEARQRMRMAQAVTEAELEAVPVHAVLIDRDGEPFQKISDRTFFDYTEQRYLSAEELATDVFADGQPTYAPLTIVYVRGGAA